MGKGQARQLIGLLGDHQAGVQILRRLRNS